MEGTRLGFVAAVALVAGLGGCSLPQVLPLEGTTSAGPSPYGVWYEQHWATNSVLLAAADQPAEDIEITDDEVSISIDPDADVDATMGTQASDEEAAIEAQAAAWEAQSAAFEAGTAPGQVSDAVVEEFDESSPYQFPASSFAPAPTDAPPPADAAPPPSEGPIRY